MRKNIISTLLIAGAIFLTASCDWNNDSYYEFTTFATVVSSGSGAGSSQYNVVTDDSLLITPTNFAYTGNDNDRVIVSFYSETDVFESPLVAEISGVTAVNTGEIIQVADPSSLPQGYLKPESVWYSGGVYGAKRFITFGFTYPYVTLLTADPFILADSGMDDNGYYHLFMTHSIDISHNNYTYANAYMSYPLDERLTADGVKGLIITFYTFDEKYEDYTLDY